MASWRDEQATQAFAQVWAQALQQRTGLGNWVMTLHGNLGAGKTTLVRHLLHALGVDGRIKSPTYALVEPYEIPLGFIWHFDFYRFNDPREWEEAGLRDIFSTPGLKLVEWPEKAGDQLPAVDMAIDLEVQDDATRVVRLCAHTDQARALLLSITK